MKRSVAEYEEMALAEMEGTSGFVPTGPVEYLPNGRPTKGRKGKSPTRTVRFSESQLIELEQLADAQNITMSVLLRRAAAEYVARHRPA